MFKRAWPVCLIVSLLTSGSAQSAERPAARRGESPPTQTAEKLRAGDEIRIVCFGDSVTGLYYHTGGKRAYTDMLALALRKTYPDAKLTAINAGISGNTTADALLRIDKDVLAHKPTLVTVMFGLNDMVRVPLDQFRANLQSIIEKCRGAGAEVLLCTPNNVINTGGRPIDKLVEYCGAIRDVSRAQNVALCDCYDALEKLRSRDALAWRLLLSDEIHPNMDGHKREAEFIAQSITGRAVSLDDVPPPSPAIERTLSLIAQGQPVKILAMPPYDELIRPALAAIAPDAKLKITPWPVAGSNLKAIAEDAKQRVRTAKPDLVLIAVPPTAQYDNREALISNFTWIMNWSLSFGRQEWDCVVVHPNVAVPGAARGEAEALLRRLVATQDLTLIDRGPKDRQSAAELLAAWCQAQSKPSK